MIAFVYKNQVAPGKTIKVYLAETLNAGKSVANLPLMKWRGADIPCRPTETRCHIEEEPNGTVECVTARILNIINAYTHKECKLKFDASFEDRKWDVYLIIPA